MDTDMVEPNIREKVAFIPIDEIDVARPSLFQKDTVGLFFERLRREEPVHYCRESYVGPYWSITKFDDIMAVDTNHKVFSSEAKLGGIAIDRLYARFARRHPQLGPFRKRGGGCGCCAAKDGCQDPASCRG